MVAIRRFARPDGGRTLVFRIRYRAGEPPLFEWAEVDRRQLRTLVTALLMTEEQFRLSTGGETDADGSPGGLGAANHRST